jgi:hypothetical protein
MTTRMPAAGRSADRRHFPRVALVTEVEVEGPRGSRWPASSVDVSRGGMQLRCPQAQALAIVAECREGRAEDRGVRVIVRFRLRGEPAGSPLVARGRIVYVRPIASDRVIMGLEFTGFEGAGYDSLQAYVIEALRY